MWTTDEDVVVVMQRSEAAPDIVCDIVSQLDRPPSWASELAMGIERRENAWFAMSPMGEVKVVMAPIDPHGVTVLNASQVTLCGACDVLASR